MSTKNKTNALNVDNELPAHIQAILAGAYTTQNEIAIKPVETARQKQIKELQNTYAVKHTSVIDAIESDDYSYEYHEASEGEHLTIEA